MTTFDSSKLVKAFYLLADLLLKNRVRVLSGILCNYGDFEGTKIDIIYLTGGNNSQEDWFWHAIYLISELSD